MWDGPDGEPRITRRHECLVPLSRVLSRSPRKRSSRSTRSSSRSRTISASPSSRKRPCRRIPHLLLPPAAAPPPRRCRRRRRLAEIVLKGRLLPASLKSPGSSQQVDGALHVGEERAAPPPAAARRHGRRQAAANGWSSLGSPLGKGGASSGGKDESGEVRPSRPSRPLLPADAEDDAGRRPRRAVAPDVLLRGSARHEPAQGRGAVGPVARAQRAVFISRLPGGGARRLLELRAVAVLGLGRAGVCPPAFPQLPQLPAPPHV